MTPTVPLTAVRVARARWEAWMRDHKDQPDPETWMRLHLLVDGLVDAETAAVRAEADVLRRVYQAAVALVAADTPDNFNALCDAVGVGEED